ncbi:NADH-quinone oxidoreductase subunit C [Desulfovibrio sp. OttesenSCG-928-A18]|nr:NADH-quinone oxidoreductase subunit C [Desulfovibrio sp. OttesenSCG-928-A18]
MSNFEATSISLDEIRSTAREMYDGGWRLVTQTAVDRGDKRFELLYHYDKDLVEKHFRVSFTQGTIVPSISDIYFAALLVENENRDLFGLEYDGLVLDFNRSFYLEEAGDPMTAPFCKISTFTKPKVEV